MRKLLIFASIALAFTGCKKEEVSVVQQSTSINKQVADVIKKADADLYDQIYNNTNSKKPKPSIKYCPGVFVILQGDPASGTCFPNQNVCFVIITFGPLVEGGDDGPAHSQITSNLIENYEEGDFATLILNTPHNNPPTKGVRSLNVNFDNPDGISVSFTE